MDGISVDFSRAGGLAVVDGSGITDVRTGSRVWAEFVASAVSIDADSSASGPQLVTNWSTFLRLIENLRHLCAVAGIPLTYSADASSRLRDWVLDRNGSAGTEVEIDPETLARELGQTDWDVSKRLLTSQQTRDLAKILGLRNGAIFSVPGAGKTTVALALNQIWSQENPRSSLIVVAPKNAFAAWDEAVRDCLKDESDSFVRLIGGTAAIRDRLLESPRFSIISYGQFASASEVIASYLLSHQVHLILDESHRIKGGVGRVQAREVLRVAPFARRRDVLSGTPMPQSKADLEAQFEFLYPVSDIALRIRNAERVGDAIRPLFARTRYSELGVPRPVTEYISVEMSDSQRLLYGLLRDDVIKAAARERGSVDLGRPAIMRLLQVSIDPQSAAEALLRSAGDPRGVLSDVCQQVIAEGLSPRLESAVEIARNSVAAGQKIVVWAPFTGTIERLATELEEFGAKVLYGATPTGDVDEDGTREQIIAQFHDSDRHNVLIANPAAGGEGISLHRVCHHALYVGRTYNATHYMQSRDRINRLGLPAGVTTRMTILESQAPMRLGSIDLSVRRRLDAKIAQLADALDDPDLRAVALESLDADPALDDGITLPDLLDLLDELQSSGK